MFIDRTHRRWAYFTSIAVGVLGVHWLLPYAGVTLEWVRVLYGLMGCLCCVVANLYAIRNRRLGKKVKLALWQRTHIWVALLSAPCVFCHCSPDWGWWRGVGFLLMMCYLAIMVSGLMALLGHHLLPLKSKAEKGKALTAGKVIHWLVEASLYVHVPLTGAFWPLLIVHVWSKMYY